ncbi:MAG: F0F1 ATP synthase subunit epsilon [Candidatus Binatia bacterium]|jgi:F-type H+-transporting ATPase subunit epsilon|nr:F0F1 ATP synthase subunit epsilon [Candidatus Binatia bacterium]
MADKIRLRLVTPNRFLLDEEVDEVTGPGVLGEFGVLPNHISYLSALEIGEMNYRREGERVFLSVSGGYAEVLDNVVTILADAAEFSGEIDVERARRARENAEKKIEEVDRESKEFLSVEAALYRALLRIRVAARVPRR